MQRHTLDQVLRAGLAWKQAQQTAAPPRPVRPNDRLRTAEDGRKQSAKDSMKDRRAEAVQQSRQEALDEADAVAVLRTMQAIDLYSMDLNKPELALLVAWMAVGRTLVQFGYVDKDLVDDFTAEVEVAMFYAEVEEIPENLDSVTQSASSGTDAPMTDYEFSIVADFKDAGASLSLGVRKFVDNTFGFNRGARAARASGGNPKGIWKKIKPWITMLADNLPNVLLFLSIRKLEGVEADNDALLGADDVTEALALDKRIRSRFNWTTDFVRNLGSTLTLGVVAPPSTDPNRNSQVSEAFSDMWTSIMGVLGAIQAGPRNGGLEQLENVRNLLDVRLPKARDLVKVSKQVAGQTRPTQLAVIVWAALFFLLQRLMNHSRSRLQAFVRANGPCTQKHALVVWRKYIDAKEIMFAGRLSPVANRVTDDELKQLSFVGGKWDSIPDVNKTSIQFDDFWIVAKQTYEIWNEAHSKLNAATKNTAAKIFQGDYRGAMNGTLGVSFEVINRFMTSLPFARDYISVGSQAISVLTYLYWRYTTAERVKQLQAALASALSVKLLLATNVTPERIRTYERVQRERWNLDSDWEADPVKASSETTVAEDFDTSRIKNRRPREDYKIKMETVRCAEMDEDE